MKILTILFLYHMNSVIFINQFIYLDSACRLIRLKYKEFIWNLTTLTNLDGQFDIVYGLQVLTTNNKITLKQLAHLRIRYDFCTLALKCLIKAGSYNMRKLLNLISNFINKIMDVLPVPRSIRVWDFIGM